MNDKTDGLFETFIVIVIFIIGYVMGCIAMNTDMQKEIEKERERINTIQIQEVKNNGK